MKVKNRIGSCCSLGWPGSFHSHRYLILLLELLYCFVMFVLFLFEVGDARLAPFNLLIDELHSLAHILAAFLQLLSHQHRPVEFIDLDESTP